MQVAQLSCLHYNNCNFLAHELIQLPFMLRPPMAALLGHNWQFLTIADDLRAAGQASLDTQVSLCCLLCACLLQHAAGNHVGQLVGFNTQHVCCNTQQESVSSSQAVLTHSKKPCLGQLVCLNTQQELCWAACMVARAAGNCVRQQLLLQHKGDSTGNPNVSHPWAFL